MLVTPEQFQRSLFYIFFWEKQIFFRFNRNVGAARYPGRALEPRPSPYLPAGSALPSEAADRLESTGGSAVDPKRPTSAASFEADFGGGRAACDGDQRWQ